MPRMPLFFTEYLKSGCRLDGSGPLLCQLSFSFDKPYYLLIHEKKGKEQGGKSNTSDGSSDLLYQCVMPNI